MSSLNRLKISLEDNCLLLVVTNVSVVLAAVVRRPPLTILPFTTTFNNTHNYGVACRLSYNPFYIIRFARVKFETFLNLRYLQLKRHVTFTLFEYYNF